MTLARTLPAAVAALALTLTACAASGEDGGTDADTTTAAVLADHDLDGLDAAQIVERLDTTALADRPDDLIASVEPTELVLTDEQEREARLPLPDGRFYLSVAPYVDQTHACFFHSLTTCTGEIRNEPVDVTVVDDASGEVVVDETLRTYDNGFVGVWLPSGTELTVTVEHEGRSGSASLSTDEEGPTCLTSLQLA